MMDSFSLFLVVIFLALIFDFINGFHDLASAIATVTSIPVMIPRTAIASAALMNLADVFNETAIAKTVGSGLVAPHAVTR